MKQGSFFLLVISLFFFYACEQESALTPNPNYTGTIDDIPNSGNNGGNNPTNSGTMTAQVDGSPWTATTKSAQISNGLINVTGIAANGHVITLTLLDEVEGTYDLFSASEGAAAYQTSTNPTDPSWVSHDSGGTVIVSSINTSNKTISGTFEFVGSRQSDNSVRVISSGQFNVPYLTELPPQTNGNSLSADIDGTPFTASNVTRMVMSGFGLNIVGSDNQGIKSIGFRVPENISPGTYTLGGVGVSDYMGNYNASASEFYESDSGQLVISKHNLSTKEIEGTFSFTATSFLLPGSIQITNGSFRLTY